MTPHGGSHCQWQLMVGRFVVSLVLTPHLGLHYPLIHRQSFPLSNFLASFLEGKNQIIKSWTTSPSYFPWHWNSSPFPLVLSCSLASGFLFPQGIPAMDPTSIPYWSFLLLPFFSFFLLYTLSSVAQVFLTKDLWLDEFSRFLGTISPILSFQGL